MFSVCTLWKPYVTGQVHWFWPYKQKNFNQFNRFTAFGFQYVKLAEHGQAMTCIGKLKSALDKSPGRYLEEVVQGAAN